MSISISDISSLGNIFEEEIVIDNRIISIPRPFGSTDNNTAINLTGKVRSITISGSQSGQGYTGSTVTEKIGKFITDMEDWVNTNTQTAKTYTSSFGNTYSVLSTNFRWTKTNPGNRILYVITMVEGSSLAAFS